MGQVADRRAANAGDSVPRRTYSPRSSIPTATSAFARIIRRWAIFGKEILGDLEFSGSQQITCGNRSRKECYCTNEVFLWPSITYQPAKLIQAMMGAKVWQGVKPLDPSERWR